MATHRMNKNVTHDGKALPKGSVIKEDHAAFKEMKAQGHVESIGDVEPTEEKTDGEGGDEAQAQHGKKHGRK